jgi:hypothetical protein
MVIGCSDCTHKDCPLMDPLHQDHCAEGHRVLTGWSFSLVCSLVFLMPIALAVAGSLAFQADRLMGLAGGVGGFLLGWVLSTFATRYFVVSK